MEAVQTVGRDAIPTTLRSIDLRSLIDFERLNCCNSTVWTAVIEEGTLLTKLDRENLPI